MVQDPGRGGQLDGLEHRRPANAQLTKPEEEPADKPEEKTVWSGVFTVEQAARGKETAEATCAACHASDMLGDTAPALTGDAFIGHWYGAKLTELVDKVETMPADAPGSLKNEEYADVVAYMLQLNGFPAGQEALVIEPTTTLDMVEITKQQ